MLLSKMQNKFWKPTKGYNSKSYGPLATILWLRSISFIEVGLQTVKILQLWCIHYVLVFSIAPDKAIFHLKSTDIFLISPWRYMLWALNRSASEAPRSGTPNEYP